MPRSKKLFVVLFILLLSSSSIYPQSPTVIKINRIDSFIKLVRDSLGIKTGLTISVVRGDSILFENAYGYSDIEKKVPATVNTPFYIASSTKSFTAELTKILSDEGALNIDDPISEYLPGLELPPPLNIQTISLRDLLTHRSGIESIPIVLRTAYTGQFTNKKLLELFSKCRFTGKKYRYTNTDYVLASIIIDSVTGKSWKDLLKEKIFDPLGMKNTSTYVSHYVKSDLPASYTTTAGRAIGVRLEKTDATMHAAGGIYSTADDLAKWLLFNINNGRFNGKQIVSAESMKEIHSAQEDFHQTFFKYKRFAYGLGWIRSDYGGRLLIHHFGSYVGTRAHISFMPEEKMGVALLINDDGDAFYTPDLVADYVYNVFGNVKNADSIAYSELNYITERAEREKEKEESKTEREEIPLPADFNYGGYTGVYTDDDFGSVKIEKKDNGLFLAYGNMKGDMSYKDRNNFTAVLGQFKVKVEFDFDDKTNPAGSLIIYGPVKMTFKKKG